ncbi:MAG: sensor histidine kinase [Kamptonema sp. SIO4C4]|nr:sensor histidine kinase [Kamptonema sp. SIO4C4]
MEDQLNSHLLLSLAADFSPESTLQDLTLSTLSIDASQTGQTLADHFLKTPLLPGVIVTDEGRFVGAISRRQLLECTLLPNGEELFLKQPLRVLCNHTQADLLILPGKMPVLTAMRKALKRSPRLTTDPLVVCLSPQDYRILDFGQLSLISWQIRGIETQIRYERSQAQMIQSEKMTSLGRLVDGIAHEILDPVGFIWGNLTHVSNYADNLMELIQAYESHFPQPPTDIVELHHEIEAEYLQKDLPQAVESIATGAKRLRNLAMSLQNFCHVDEVYPKPADLHACLDSILLLLKSRLSSEIQVVQEYGHLPPVNCYIGKVTQVFMNILTNAVDVLLDRAVTQEWAQEYRQPITTNNPPTITITTKVCERPSRRSDNEEERFVSIGIADNGPGLSEEQQQRIRDSFSIERRAAKETSLSVSYQIITAKHGGEFHLRSQLGQGTEFEILLPLE